MPYAKRLVIRDMKRNTLCEKTYCSYKEIEYSI